MTTKESEHLISTFSCNEECINSLGTPGTADIWDDKITCAYYQDHFIAFLLFVGGPMFRYNQVETIEGQPTIDGIENGFNCLTQCGVD